MARARTKKRTSSAVTHATGIAKCHKNRHGTEYQITGDAIQMLDGYANYFVANIGETAKRVNAYRKSGTFSRDHAEVATRLVLPGKLGKRAADTGRRAVEQYLSSTGKLKPKKPSAQP